MSNYPARFHDDWPYQTRRYDLRPLLAKYTPWEVEEIVCVQQYLHDRIQEIFDILGTKLMNSIMTNLGHGQAATTQTPPRRIADESEVMVMSRFDEGREDYFFSVDAGKVAQEELITFLAGRTFPFLRALSGSEAHTQRCFVFNYVGFDRDRLLEAIERTYEGEGGVEAPSNRIHYAQNLELEDDELANCNLAWLWSADMRLPSHRCSSWASNLRDWGYIFWDQDRIKRSKVLRQSRPQQVHRQCPLNRERMNEASIQRRLEEMNLPEGRDLVVVDCNE